MCKELLADKRTAQKNLLWSVLRNEGNSWSEFYMYVKRRKGNQESIPAIKDHGGTIIKDTTEKANFLNSYYAYVFCSDRYISEIKSVNSGESFIITSRIIRIRLAKMGRNKSVEPDGFPGEILKFCGEAIAPYLPRLLETSLINATIPSDREIPPLFIFTKGVIDRQSRTIGP